MSKMDERILVVPRVVLFGLADGAAFQGVETDADKVATALHSIAAHGRLHRRGDAERDPDYKQPIPYCVLTRKGERGLEVFAYERLSGGGEARLHGKASIGVGGHMNLVPDVEAPADVILAEALREIDEEVSITACAGLTATPIGLINDDTDEVGRVHVGILIEAHLAPGAEVHVRETEQLAGGWHTLDELRAPAWQERMEGWSVLTLRALPAARLRKATGLVR